jgi:hypothetical protein
MEVHRVELRQIEEMRDSYRHEMNCQIIHDSIHARPGWTQEYLITDGGMAPLLWQAPGKRSPRCTSIFCCLRIGGTFLISLSRCSRQAGRPRSRPRVMTCC